MATREDRVKEFNETAGGRTESQGGSFGVQLICFSEELAELNEAMAQYVAAPSETKRKELIKEWADVQVTLSNLAWFFEFDGEEAFKLVADANMSKFNEDGTPILREDGKVLKGPNYAPADMTGL